MSFVGFVMRTELLENLLTLLNKIADKYITVIGAPERLVIKNTSPDPNGDERDS